MTANSEIMPVVFVGHGSPMNIVLKNSYTEDMTKAGKALPKPKAILVVSAHWLTGGTYVGCMEKPETIYDFYGFPEDLYRIRYQCPGSPDFARLVTKIVKNAEVKCGSNWGLDHASWAVLKHMYPKADIPVFELSLDYSPYNDWRPKSVEFHYRLAADLAPLREKGVLIMGSGNIVHNLGLIDFNPEAKPFDWAVRFDEQIKRHLENDNHEALMNFLEIGKEARWAVPTLDHYLPMIYAIALQRKGESLKWLHEGFQHGSVSMRAFQIG